MRGFGTIETYLAAVNRSKFSNFSIVGMPSNAVLLSSVDDVTARPQLYIQAKPLYRSFNDRQVNPAYVFDVQAHGRDFLLSRPDGDGSLIVPAASLQALIDADLVYSVGGLAKDSRRSVWIHALLNIARAMKRVHIAGETVEDVEAHTLPMLEAKIHDIDPLFSPATHALLQSDGRVITNDAALADVEDVYVHRWASTEEDVYAHNRARTDEDVYAHRRPSSNTEDVTPESYAFYHGSMSFKDTEALLLPQPVGTFVLRSSNSERSAVVLAFKDAAGGVQQTLVDPCAGGYKVRGKDDAVFPNIDAIIAAHPDILRHPLPASAVASRHLRVLLRAYPFYHGSVSFGDAEKLLVSQPAGTFLLRSSNSDPAVVVLAFIKTAGGVVQQVLIDPCVGGFVLRGETTVFPSIDALITAYSGILQRPLNATVFGQSAAPTGGRKGRLRETSVRRASRRTTRFA